MNIYKFEADNAGFRVYNLTKSAKRQFWDSFVEKEYGWGRKSVKSIWQPLEIELVDPYGSDYYECTGEPSTEFSDFAHCYSISPPIYSERAVQILSPYLADSVEFLPLKCDDDIFYACKVLSIMDNALDLEKSKIEWEPQTQKQKENKVPPWFRAIKEYVFNEDVIKDLLIFIQEQEMLEIYVTQCFVDIVNEHGLTGGRFTQVYPPEDPNEIRRRAYEKAMKRRKKKNQK
jgi:hypothetical protein